MNISVVSGCRPRGCRKMSLGVRYNENWKKKIELPCRDLRKGPQGRNSAERGLF